MVGIRQVSPRSATFLCQEFIVQWQEEGFNNKAKMNSSRPFLFSNESNAGVSHLNSKGGKLPYRKVYKTARDYMVVKISHLLLHDRQQKKRENKAPLFNIELLFLVLWLNWKNIPSSTDRHLLLHFHDYTLAHHLTCQMLRCVLPLWPEGLLNIIFNHIKPVKQILRHSASSRTLISICQWLQ